MSKIPIAKFSTDTLNRANRPGDYPSSFCQYLEPALFSLMLIFQTQTMYWQCPKRLYAKA